MGSLSEEEECRFFDASEDVALMLDAHSGRIEAFDSNRVSNDAVECSFQYEMWMQSPKSVEERRSKFFAWMRVELDRSVRESSEDVWCSEGGVVQRVAEQGGAVLRKSSCFEGEFCSSRSLVSWWSNDYSDLTEDLSLRGDSVCRDRNANGACCSVDDDEDGHNQFRTSEVSESTWGSSATSGQLSHEANGSVETIKKVKKGWLNRLRSFACVADRQRKADKLRGDEDYDIYWRQRVQRVKVHHRKKQLKELSALFKGQDIQAHEGSILTMKFSPDGQFLASAGEDGIVRVWQVVEDARSDELDMPEVDPSCVYFTVDQLSELKPLCMDKEKVGKMRSLRKTSDSACVIFPPKVFRILERPVHEFRGHCGEILDLSWSKNNYLLSCSVDMTVRLWRVGSDHCLRVFPHSNYVTCVQFNPVDVDYFISGSLDGKVRIWSISGCQVVDWTDVRDLVTAACYRPDGKGGIVGCISGSCRFFNMSDHHLQLDAQISLHTKKKLLSNRITGFQFSPEDSSKVMVTCADSQVRILHGHTVVGKYKGVRNAGSQISACFTSDGKHIVSACEDSNVYMWNCDSEVHPPHAQARKIRSCERFSTNASIAIPWSGMKAGNSGNRWHGLDSDDNMLDGLPFASPVGFSLNQGYVLESFPKGSATWPEEKLPTSSPMSKSSVMHKSHYKFLKTSCQNTISSHAWGMVIVTAGWDGRIRSFYNYGLPVPI